MEPAPTYNAGTNGTDTAARLDEALRRLAASEWETALLSESLRQLEAELFAEGWTRLSWQADQEFSKAGIDQIAQLGRVMYLKNPLIRRGVKVQRLYVWAQGVTIKSPDEQVDDVVQAFWNDPKNQAELTTQQAAAEREVDLQLSGNLFFVLFTSRQGRVRVRTIPLEEITEIISDPEDARSPWYYVREWDAEDFSLATGETTVRRRKAYYPDWRYSPASKPPAIGGSEVRWDSPIYHVRTGGISQMQFGVSEVYAAIDWARAYKEFLEDWATLTRAYSRWAHKLTVKGGARGVTAAKSKLASTYAANSGTTGETNPPPVVGSTFIGAEGVEMNPIRIGGANISAEDGRRILLMVAAGVGLPETFFGDVSVGTLATAKSLDRPTELAMRERQSFWRSIIRDILSYVKREAVRARRLPGMVVREEDIEQAAYPDDVDPATDISFPAILEEDVSERIDAIVSAATLDGKTPAQTMPYDTLVTLLLTALGVEGIDGILEDMASATPPGQDMREALSELREAIHGFAQRWAVEAT